MALVRKTFSIGDLRKVNPNFKRPLAPLNPDLVKTFMGVKPVLFLSFDESSIFIRT